MIRPLMSVPFVVTFLHHKSHWQHIKYISVAFYWFFVLLQRHEMTKERRKTHTCLQVWELVYKPETQVE